MISVGFLPHDFNIKSYTEAYFAIFFEYPWDWDRGQLDFRLSTSLGLPTIDCIRTSLHGFVEIEMDHIRFHLRSMGGSFSRTLMRWIVFAIVILRVGLSRWAIFYTLWYLLLDEPWYTRFEIHLLRFVDRAVFFSDTEASFSFDFSEVCHDVLVPDPLISADDWFTGCFSSVSTLDTGAYFSF